jgi:hypothetical protein
VSTLPDPVSEIISRDSLLVYQLVQHVITRDGVTSCNRGRSCTQFTGGETLRNKQAVTIKQRSRGT